MKPLTIGLFIFGFVIFMNKPLFSEPLSEPANTAQPEKPVIFDSELPVEDIAQIYLDYESITTSTKPFDPYIEPKKTDDIRKEADLKKHGTLYAYKLYWWDDFRPQDQNNRHQGDVGPNNNERNYSPQNHDSRNLPSQKAIDELFEFFEREKESMRKIDLEDGESLKRLIHGDEVSLEFAERIDSLLAIQDEIGAIDVVVLDAVEFNSQIRAIHKLLNPPARLDPLLKWLLYLNRLTPEMIELYQAALEKRDRIYLLASRSQGKLKIRLNGKIMSDAVYVWPDQDAHYELVAVASDASKLTQPQTPSIP
jgi:hypothetical protein